MYTAEETYAFSATACVGVIAPEDSRIGFGDLVPTSSWNNAALDTESGTIAASITSSDGDFPVRSNKGSSDEEDGGKAAHMHVGYLGEEITGKS